MDKQVYLLYAETQVHAGSGFEIGVVDLPIQRERTTGFPIIQGVKGALRAFFRNTPQDNLESEIFGDEIVQNNTKKTKPGKVAFSEAKILLFPVRSQEKLFIWVTCPLVLSRFLNVAGEKEALEEIVKLQLEEDRAIALDGSSRIYIEEISLNARNDVCLEKFRKVLSGISTCAPIQSLQTKMSKDVAIVSDTMFCDIVKTMTEVIPRIRINEVTKTVEEGALWYEEYLPQDTVMYFVARVTAYGDQGLLKNLCKKIDGKIVNVGGKETIGKGMMWVKCFGGDEDEKSGT